MYGNRRAVGEQPAQSRFLNDAVPQLKIGAARLRLLAEASRPEVRYQAVPGFGTALDFAFAQHPRNMEVPVALEGVALVF